ncbi:uncharacterized protein BJX67DRAFT_360349 [Aspergillus lucknowensis]|uniref:Deoxyribonuclease NucA/NucB domain-containing protein n=1 Tax=Aspergillus lucknowensis TaxID=176173 RepID=A0ABR4LN60_9EURO
MCPQGFCAKAVDEFVDQFYPDGVPDWAKGAIEAAGDMECDEFPFANSLQGGDAVNGVAMCIPADDNSFQGDTMSPYFSRKDIVAGEDYMIEIQGWDCDAQEPTRRRRDIDHAAVHPVDELGPIAWSSLVKRDSFDEAIQRYGDAMYHGFDISNPRLNLMTMPLGDLAAGIYLVNLNITKGNLSYNVVDYVGNTVEATILANGSVTFTLDEDWEAVSLTGRTEEEDVELSYKAEVFPAPEGTTTTQAAVPSTTGSGGDLVKPGGAVSVAVACLVAFGFSMSLEQV